MVKKYNLQDTLKIAHGINKMPVAYSISNLIVSSSIEPEAFGRVSVDSINGKTNISQQSWGIY